MVQIAYARRPLLRKPIRAGLAQLGPDQFEGYASLFNVRDGAGDSVAPGAFAASLRSNGPARVRMLYQHFSHAPIGVWEEIAEDRSGLYVRGRLTQDVEQARDVAALLRDGALNGLSIGFRTRRARRGPGNTRTLLEVELWGLVRLLDAAASGADLRDVAARVAPGQPDDAASDVALSEIAAVLAGNLGAARQNAGQLEALEKAVGETTSLMSSRRPD